MLRLFQQHMTQNMSNFTSIGRPVDPRYPTNMAISIIMAITTLAMFVFQLFTGTNFVQAGIQGIMAGLTIFLVWAFAREIDPEEQLSAFVPVVLMFIVLFTIDAGYNLLVLFYMMTLARIVNRSVGLPAKLTDSVIILVFTGIIAYLYGWIYALLGVMAFLLDAMLPEANNRHKLFALLALIVTIVVFVLQGSTINPTFPSTDYLIVILLAGLIFIPVIWMSRQLNVAGDANAETLIPIRVQATQILILAFAYVIAFWQGNEGIMTLLPLWIIFAGLAVFPLIKPLLPEINLEMRASKSQIDAHKS